MHMIDAMIPPIIIIIQIHPKIILKNIIFKS